jgi:hypothetical protein
MLYDKKVIARLWAKVDVTKSDQECWEWRGATRHHGYGGIKVNGRVERAHRLAWEFFNDELLGDRWALHSCDNPKCCNPMHIYPGDSRKNSDDYSDRHHFSEFRKQFGERKLKLTQWQVFLVRREIIAGTPPEIIMQQTGLTSASMSRIRNDQCHKGLWPTSAKDTDFLSAVRKHNKAKMEDTIRMAKSGTEA